MVEHASQQSVWAPKAPTEIVPGISEFVYVKILHAVGCSMSMRTQSHVALKTVA